MAKKSPPDISPVMQGLATYIAQATKKPLPKEVVERTKHHLLDTLAAQQTGRAAAEEHRIDLAPPDQRQSQFQIADQRRNVLLLGKCAPRLV